MEKFIILILVWAFYCFLHSFLIAPAVTGFIKEKTGDNFRFYRIFYNTFAILSLVPVLIYTYSLGEQPFFTWSGYLLPLRFIMIFTALAFFYGGSKNYDMKTFAGFRQISEKSERLLINSSGKLNRDGLLSVVRHPFYAGSFPLIWSGNLDRPRLIVNIILSVYLVTGTFLEERKLIAEFGETYREYRRDVSMLFPWKYIKSRLFRA